MCCWVDRTALETNARLNRDSTKRELDKNEAGVGLNEVHRQAERFNCEKEGSTKRAVELGIIITKGLSSAAG